MASNFKTNGVDLETFIGGTYVTKSYMIDMYPSIMSNLLQATLWTFGDASHGQLGDSTITSKSSPVQSIARSADWRQVAVGAGFGSAAIKNDGTLWLWGQNGRGQLGDNSSTNKSSPVQIVTGGTTWKQVAVGTYHAAAVKTDGTLWLWGKGAYGELGNSATTDRSSPVQTTAAGTTWKSVACGGGTNDAFHAHTAAIKTDGTLWTWGGNDMGQLGDNSITSRSSPVQTTAGGSTWKMVATGDKHTAAIKTDGTLWMCGYNHRGQLGTNDTTKRSSPIQTTAGGNNWRTVATASNSVAAIKTDGTLWVWGQNANGQLGDGTVTHRSSPIQTVAGGTMWKQAVVGELSMVALKSDGTLWSWGRGQAGRLGNNTTTDTSSPVQVIGGATWAMVGGGIRHSVAIKMGIS